MESTEPIETEIGILRGRDCIFLDRVSVKTTTLGLAGEINCSNVLGYRPPLTQLNACLRQSDSNFLPFSVKFQDVLGFEMLELDAWLSMYVADGIPTGYSFENVVESTWIKKIGTAIVGDRRHFRLTTYDAVFDVISETYALAFPIGKSEK